MAEESLTSSSQSLRARDSARISNPNIFSDDFALEPLEITDDHQTASSNRGSNHEEAAATTTPRQSSSFQQASGSPGGSLRRSGGSQNSDGYSSTVSRSDNYTSRFSSPPRSITSVSDSGNTVSTQHRSVGTISTFGFPRAQSPYHGPTGPSQPYGLYSQDIGLSRNPSTGTTSTIRRPERSYSGPNGPTQPYGMYAQNTVPEDDAELIGGLAPQHASRLPASHQNYQRRLGPDGEDADDLIGPDGYTEQLPPYSRYANGVPPKYTSGLGNIDSRNTPPAPEEALRDSQETLNNSPSRDADLINPFSDSSTQLSSTASPAIPPKHEDASLKERIQRRSKKKVCCGISCWLCLAMVVVVFLAVLLGGVVGGVVAHKRGEEKGINEAPAAQTVTAPAAAPTATVTQMSPPPDAVSLSSTPSNLPPLPTGSFSISLDKPTTVTNSCLTNSDQACAWDCATGAGLNMAVQMAGPNRPMVSLSYPEPSNPSIRYGAQPPELSGLANLILMKDKDESSKGPAYLFTQQYNKTVIVHNSDLPGGLPNSKRSLIQRWFSTGDVEGRFEVSKRYTDDSQWTSNSIAKPADKPWYCYWPNTILEGFIYITQDVEQSENGSAASSEAAMTTSPPSAPSGVYEKRQAPANIQLYPKVVKIEERRSPLNPIKPYCQQMQILNTNQPGPLTNPATGQLIQIQLEETEIATQHQFDQDDDFGQAAPSALPSIPAMPQSLPGGRRAKYKRTSTGSGPLCQCEWMSG